MSLKPRSIIITGAGSGIDAAAARAFAESGDRAGQSAEVAATIHFMASPGAAYINGEVIHVDGGWIAS